MRAVKWLLQTTGTQPTIERRLVFLSKGGLHDVTKQDEGTMIGDARTLLCLILEGRVVSDTTL